MKVVVTGANRPVGQVSSAMEEGWLAKPSAAGECFAVNASSVPCGENVSLSMREKIRPSLHLADTELPSD